MIRTALLCTFLATTALAAPKRVLVAGLPAGVKLVEASLGKSVEVVRQEPLADELTASALVDLMRTSAASAIISVHQGLTEDTVTVYNGVEGATLASLRAKHSKKAALKVLPKPLVAQLQRAVASSRPPKALPRVVPAPPPPRESAPVATPPEAAPAPAVAPAAAEVAPAPAPPSPPKDEPMIARVGLGVRAFQRSLKWTDDLFQRMPTYALPFGPAAAVDAEFYPLAIAAPSSPLSRLGATAAFEQSIGLSSTDSEGQRFQTSAMRFRAGAQYSQPISILTLRVHAGWSMQSFGFSALSTAAEQKVNIPNVRYAALRGGLGLGVRLFGPLSFELGGAYQYVLSSGELGSAAYFSHVHTGGADFTAGLTWRVMRNFEVRATAEYQRYWMTLNPQPGDPWIAGGALDEYKSIHLSLAWVL